MTPILVNNEMITSSFSPIPDVNPTMPDISSRQYFEELMNNHQAIHSPEVALDIQHNMNVMTVSTALAAKVVGSVAQSVNKLANTQ